MGTVVNMRCIVLYSVLVSLVLADYTPYYPDYTDSSYNYSYTPTSPRYKRVINVDNPLSIGTTLDFTVPLPDFSSEILVTVPFSLDIPVASSRSASGRSFSSSSSLISSPRSTMYRTMEKYVGQITGADGHACLLRAMCEASAAPLHDEGLLGDAVNFLLTANYAAQQSDHDLKKYVAAQAQGQLSQDCLSYHKGCPFSFFKLIDLENSVGMV